LPVVLRLARHIRVRLDTRPQVREVVRNFVPVFFSRGVVQISAYVDVVLASYLPTGAVAGLTNAQTLYTLPVSLFGMAVSAAELPAMSSALGDASEVAAYLQRRLNAGLRQIAFFVVPSAMAFLALGGVIAALLFQNGRFSHADSQYVWAIVAGSSVGLLASTSGVFIRRPTTPCAIRARRCDSPSSAWRSPPGWDTCAPLPLPRWIGIDPRGARPG
jgi:putative peptidoglycan lipid II flippase